MNKARYYKYMFIVAGAWNILAAVVFGILAPLVPGFLPFFGLEQNSIVYIWMYSFLILVAVIGFKYFLVGLDITKNHLVVSTGIIQKIAYLIVLTIFLILGQINWIFYVMIGVPVLVFVALFIEFYVNYMKLDRTEIAGAYSYKENM